MSEHNKFDQAKTKLEWIAVKNIAVVWREAQRPFSEKWADKLAADLDPEKFDPVKVMLPNGNGIYHCCEGQHRTAAVRKLWGEHEKVPCLVAQTSDPTRAAEIFLDTNTNRAHVSKVAKFKVSVVAKRLDEVAIDKVVRHCGYSVEPQSGQDQIVAVDSLKFVYNKGGAKNLDRTLHVIRQIWGGDPAAVQSSLLRGFGAFICEFSQNIDWARLSEVMRKHTPGQFAAQITAHKETLRISSVEAAVQLLLKYYNKGLRKEHQLKHKGA